MTTTSPWIRLGEEATLPITLRELAQTPAGTGLAFCTDEDGRRFTLAIFDHEWTVRMRLFVGTGIAVPTKAYPDGGLPKGTMMWFAEGWPVEDEYPRDSVLPATSWAEWLDYVETVGSAAMECRDVGG